MLMLHFNITIGHELMIIGPFNFRRLRDGHKNAQAIKISELL